MAISAKERQKRLERKARKKKPIKMNKAKAISLSERKAASYSTYPIHECLVPDGLFEIGIGNVIVSRGAPKGNIAVSVFVVDTFFLGDKLHPSSRALWPKMVTLSFLYSYNQRASNDSQGPVLVHPAHHVWKKSLCGLRLVKPPARRDMGQSTIWVICHPEALRRSI